MRMINPPKSNATIFGAMAALILASSAFSPAGADVMMFSKSGKVTTASWTFHGQAQGEEATSGAIAKPGTTSGASRPGVMLAIAETANRHARNRALRAVGLSGEDWHVLFRSLIQTESAFNPKALSPKGAMGLAQLMPDTADALGVDPKDMRQNLDGGARYLLTQLAAFRSIPFALAAYNAGPHRVKRYGGIPPFAETKNYVARINRLTGGLVLRGGASGATATTADSGPVVALK